MLNTFKNYLSLLTRRTERKIAATLPDRIELVFDGQTTPDAHYVGVFSTYLVENKDSFGMACVAPSPMENETIQTADEHNNFLSYVLSNFAMSFKNVMALIGDNCSTIQSIATYFREPLIGFFSHRFQLFVREVIYETEDAVKQVHSLMVKLLTPLFRANLHKYTHLRAKLNNNARWTVIY